MIGVTFGLSQSRAETYHFDSDRWQIEAREADFVDFKGVRALRLKGGSAMLSGVEQMNGVVEFDIAVPNLRSFSGVRFRSVDEANFEHFYIRPHQSGNPDANQYTPVFNGVTGWQLYYGAGYAAPVLYRHDEWMHIKIVYDEQNADIYIDSNEPSLLVRELKRPAQSGALGVDASVLAEAYFTNFTVSNIPEDYRFTPLDDKAISPIGTVMSWQISNAFPRAELAGTNKLSQTFLSSKSWKTLAAETTGITNFARLQGIDAENDTVVARLVVASDAAQTKSLQFGYSDDVSVYVNGTRLYSGSNFYESRDYRFLGTIGLFDTVHLPLKKGSNEVWLAVSETFGGWGVQAQFEDFDGISLKEN